MYLYAADPSGWPAPLISNTTRTSITLTWDSPNDPNDVYSILRRTPSLSPSPLRRDVGMAFDGNIIKWFNPELNFLGGIINTISFNFRTFSSQGTIIYYIDFIGSDYIAVELRNGVPWFFFDAGNGPAVIQPDLGGTDMAFNDGVWHSVTATQNGRRGNLVVDRIYSGTGQSGGTDTKEQVISPLQPLFVGGIPRGFNRSSLRGVGNPNATLDGQRFAGCLFGITINNLALDFDRSDTVVENSSRIQEIPGCPVDLMPGWAFLGGGYLAFPKNILNSTTFIWSLDIRTTHREGVVLFIHATDGFAIALELRTSVLHLLLINSITNTISIGDDSICDGLWHTIHLNRTQSEVFVSVDGSEGYLAHSSTSTISNSSMFLGGVPMNSVAYYVARDAGVNVYAPFSGCIRSRVLNVGGVITTMLTPSSRRFVRFDGCPSPYASPPDTCGDLWANMSAGNRMQFTDIGLRPWTGMIHNVIIISFENPPRLSCS